MLEKCLKDDAKKTKTNKKKEDTTNVFQLKATTQMSRLYLDNILVTGDLDNARSVCGAAKRLNLLIVPKGKVKDH